MTQIAPTKAREYRLPHQKGFSSLTLNEVDVPRPGPDEVLIKMEAVSLQYRDLIISQGNYRLPAKANLVPGSDGAGEVVAVGETIHADRIWKVGDKVAGNFNQALISGLPRDPISLSRALGGSVDGVLCEYRTFPASGLVKIPSNYTTEEASTLPCAGLTAYNSLFGAPPHILQPGQWVLILGTGGVSIFGLQFALATNANVIVTSSSDEKLKVVEQIAADKAHLLHTINYNTTPEWHKEVLKITNGRGVDQVVEVGGNQTLVQSVLSTALSGHLGLIGFLGGDVKDPLPDVNGLVLSRAAVLRGVLIGSRQQFEDMVQFIEVTSLKPVIDKTFPFDKLEEAYQYQWDQKHVGKVVIKI